MFDIFSGSGFDRERVTSNQQPEAFRMFLTEHLETRINMRLRNAVIVIVLAAWAAGCASPLKTRLPVAPQPAEHSDLLINEAQIDQKIRFLEGVLANKGVSAADRENARTVLAAYQELKEAAATRLSEKNYQRLVLSLFKAVSLMDEAYYGKAGTPGEDTRAFSLFDKKRRAIIDAYLKRDDKGVIEKTRELKAIFGPDAIIPEIGILFALSLAEVGELSQAVQVGEEIAKALDRVPDVIRLRSEIARWQLELGRQAGALQTYERLTDDQDERAAWVRETARKIGTPQRVHPVDRPVMAEPTPGQGHQDPWPEGGYTLDQLIEKVQALVHEHAYSKARLLILRERLRLGDGPENERLERELEKIDHHEAEFQAQEEIQENVLEETRAAARQLIEEENYQAAVDKLDTAEGIQELDPESRALKDRAVEGLINKERNRAAELFLAARKTDDPAKKKELLVSAYDILKNLIDAYPSSPLNPKLRSHLAVVQQELDRL
jgi:hypothetical protein